MAMYPMGCTLKASTTAIIIKFPILPPPLPMSWSQGRH